MSLGLNELINTLPINSLLIFVVIDVPYNSLPVGAHDLKQ